MWIQINKYITLGTLDCKGLGLHVVVGTCTYPYFGRTESSLPIFERYHSHYFWSEDIFNNSHRLHLQDDQFRHAMLALDWLQGRRLEGSQHVQIWYLKYQLADTEEVRAECADKGKLSGLSVHTSSMGEHFVFQIGLALVSEPWAAAEREKQREGEREKRDPYVSWCWD